MLSESSPDSSTGSDSQTTASQSPESDAVTEYSESHDVLSITSVHTPKVWTAGKPDVCGSRPDLPILALRGSRTLSNDDVYAWHRQRVALTEPDSLGAPPHQAIASVDYLETPRLKLLQQVPSAHQVDPFSTLPIEVDYTTNELLHFYLGSNTAYWSSAYGLSSKLKPSIKSAWESFMPYAEHFHILMARSALHQLRINPNLDPTFSKNLRLASIAHQGKAVASLRQKVGRGSSADQRDIFVAVLSMATFEKRYGQKEGARMHFAVGRTVLHALGKQGLAEDPRKEAQALWFEGVYSDPETSFMWTSNDLASNHNRLTTLLKDVDTIWRSWQQEPALIRRAGGRKRFISSRSLLHALIHRDCTGQLLSIYQDIDQAIAQARCLLICVAVIAGLWTTQIKLRSSREAVSAIQAWTDWVEQLIRRGGLDNDAALPDLLWCLLQDPFSSDTHQPQAPVQSVDGIREKLRDFDFQECHWRVSGIAHAMKYLPDIWLGHIRKWLLGFLDGAWYNGELIVDQFAYSYAAGVDGTATASPDAGVPV